MFYVSTWGGTASGWFARAMSLHPEVVCFQGTRSIPPYPAGIMPDMEPDAFAEGLHQLWGTSRHTKIFGATNGFHGLAMKTAIEERNGTFASAVRHPIMRIHGLYCHYATTVTDARLEGPDVYRPFREDMSEFAELELVDQTFRLKPFSREFLMMASPTVKYDMIAIRNLPLENIIRFEELTRNREYFAQCFRMLVGRFTDYAASLYDNPDTRVSVGYFDMKPEPTEAYLDTVFNQPRYGSKSRGMDLNTPEEVFDAWPDFYKFLFAMCLKAEGGITAVEDYRKLGYNLPEVYSKINYPRLSPAIWRAVAGYDGTIDSLLTRDALLCECIEKEVALRTTALRAEIETARAETKAAEREASAARERADAATAEAIAARAITDLAKGEAETARADLDALRTDNSWRISGPFRALGRRLRGSD
ncbi:MAG: hypothetical protein WD767_03535 [Alphaproteobacteria bacterium]